MCWQFRSHFIRSVEHFLLLLQQQQRWLFRRKFSTPFWFLEIRSFLFCGWLTVIAGILRAKPVLGSEKIMNKLQYLIQPFQFPFWIHIFAALQSVVVFDMVHSALHVCRCYYCCCCCRCSFFSVLSSLFPTSIYLTLSRNSIEFCSDMAKSMPS